MSRKSESILRAIVASSKRARFAVALAVVAMLSGTMPANGGDLLLVTLSNNTIVQYNVGLGTQAAIQASQTIFTSTGLNAPRGMATDGLNVYVANNGNGTINRYNASAVLVDTFVPSDPGRTGPLGMAFDNSGNLYAGFQGSSAITRFDSTGAVLPPNPFGGSFAGFGGTPWAMVFSSNGNLYATGGDSGRIQQITPGGTMSTIVTMGGGTSPRGLAIDSSNRLYVADFSGNYVNRYNTSGGLIDSFIVSGLNSPLGLLIDSAGSLYVANSGNNTIRKYDSLGVLQYTLNTPASPQFMLLPEPSTYLLGGLATGILCLFARRGKTVPKSR